MDRGGVRWAVGLLAAALGVYVGGEAAAQSYTQAESPYMVEVDFSLNEPVELFVEVGGVRLDRLRISPQGAVEEGVAVRCDVIATGSHAGGARPNISIAMLLEDEYGKGLERLAMDEFRPGRGRPFEETQRKQVSGTALLSARKLFVMVEVK